MNIAVARNRVLAIPRASLLRSQTVFCAAAGLSMVLLRLASFDVYAFFSGQSVPNHDMYQAAGLFAPSMNAVRLFGDIAWWNPIAGNGYAAYYQSFLSPLAPTPGNIVYILWAEMVRVLSLGGVAIPEYYQYLVVTYVVLPFLAFWALAAFLTLFLRHRATVLLVLIVYTLSGIGLWNGAWFYFQEPFTFFFLVWSILALLQRPTARRLLLAAVASLIQLASFNYWTEYNSWFFVIILAAYCWMHPNQLRRLTVRGRQMVSTYRTPVLVLSAVTVVAASIWTVLIGAMTAEQSGRYLRTSTPLGAYTILDAWNRTQEIRRFTTELFNPSVDRALQHYPIIVPMHNARYIGAFLLPLLALVPFFKWRRRELWLAVAAGGVLAICFAPPFLLSLWAVTPFMNHIQHEFYFYSQYWQLLIVLLAACSLEALLRGPTDGATRRRFTAAVVVMSALLIAVLAGDAALTQMFPNGDSGLQANLQFTVIALIGSAAILQFLLFPSIRARQVLVAALIVLALSDLGRYFWQVSLIDQTFTAQRWGVPLPLPAADRAALRRPWPAPSGGQLGFRANLYPNMPIPNSFWPDDSFMLSMARVQLQQLPPAVQEQAINDPRPVDFYPDAVVMTSGRGITQAVRALKLDPAWTLFLQSLPAGSVPVRLAPAGGFSHVAFAVPAGRYSATTPIAYRWRTWAYNTFSFTVQAPSGGWLLIRQIDDPYWRVTVDGKTVIPARADMAGMAVPLLRGPHLISMDYRPLSRALYWPAATILEIVLVILLLAALRSGREAPFGRLPAGLRVVITRSNRTSRPTETAAGGAASARYLVEPRQAQPGDQSQPVTSPSLSQGDKLT